MNASPTGSVSGRLGSSPNLFSTLYMDEDGTGARGTVGKLLQRYGSDANVDESEKTEKANLGTIMGVFFPCLQNIFGVIYFVRLYWIVGEAGSLHAFLIVFSCCCVSLLTSLSISAIATNGKVHGGGTYFMISRSLGPEFGGAVGILFYLGISVSVAMYLIGSIELLLEYIAPEMSMFDDRLNNFRLWGTCLLAIVAATVFTGVKFVSRVAFLVLMAVIASIISVYIGVFAANSDSSAKVCFLGDRILSSDVLMVDGVMQCTKDPDGPLYKLWCNATVANASGVCDPFFEKNDVELRAGIPGLKGGVFFDNVYNKYGKKDYVIGTDVKGSTERGEILRDIDSSYVLLLAIYFPSITGFEQGTSYSGDLEDAQKSIPLGTLAAVFVSSIVYLSTVLLFGGTVHGSVLRDKYGVSIGRQLVMSQLSWPSPWVILIGALMSTVGAGLQALTAAPRLLQAVAKDEVFGSLLRPFAYMTKRNEPIPAIALSWAIAETGILIAKLDYVAPIVTMFFLLCYGCVNFACALQSILSTPHWRPRFRFYHWILALLGVALCLALAFLSSVLYTFLALGLAAMVYKYIEYKGAEKEWGDGMRGLSMSAAQVALLRLKDTSGKGIKNWRPQLLVLVKLNENLEIRQERMLSFCSQLKAGKGLTIVASVLVGNFAEERPRLKEAKENLQNLMEQNHLEGFTDIIISDKTSHGIFHEIQTAGLGALYPNTVVIAWPDHWFDSNNRESYETFMDTLHFATLAKKAVVLLKGLDVFPSNSVRLGGTIDIWWIMYDGSMLIMLAFLLKQHKVWKNSQLRIFTVAQMKDNSVQIKKDLDNYMYNLRIPATVQVVEMEDKDISAYCMERTLLMNERIKLLEAINLGRKESVNVIDNILLKRGASDKRSRQSHAVDMSQSVSQDQKTASATASAARSAQPRGVSPDKKVGFEDTVEYTFSPAESSNHRMDVRSVFPGISENKNESAKQTVGFSASTSREVADRRKQLERTSVRKMHTAVRLNQLLVEQSKDAELVILNLPSIPSNPSSQTSYMQYLEVLSEGLQRVVMVKGTGREVITIYN